MLEMIFPLFIADLYFQSWEWKKESHMGSSQGNERIEEPHVSPVHLFLHNFCSDFSQCKFIGKNLIDIGMIQITSDLSDS